MLRSQRIFTIAVPSLMAIVLSGCAANPGPVMEKSTQKLISYFEAKNELAAALQNSLGGLPSVVTGRETPVPYRLVAINGPAYPVGSLIPLDNALDLESRDCVIAKDKLPAPEPWASFPSWTSNSKLDLGLNMPALFRGVFSKAENSLDTGATFERSGNFQVSELSQVFLSRFEVTRATFTPKCKAAIAATQNRAAIFVRGLVYGKESLKSGRSFSGGIAAKSVTTPNGEFRISFDNNGAFELTENAIKPKFAIVTKVSAKPEIKPGNGGVTGPQAQPEHPIFGYFDAPSADDMEKIAKRGLEAL